MRGSRSDSTMRDRCIGAVIHYGFVALRSPGGTTRYGRSGAIYQIHAGRPRTSPPWRLNLSKRSILDGSLTTDSSSAVPGATTQPICATSPGRSLLELATSAAPYRAFGSAVPHTWRIVSADCGPGLCFGTVPGADLHGVPRLRAGSMSRSNARTITSACVGLLPLSPFRRRRHHHAIHHATSGDIERRGSAGCDHADGVRIPGSLMARSSRVPGNPQSARHVRSRSDHRDDHRPAGADSSPTPTASSQRGRHRRGARPDRGGLCWLIGWKGFVIVWAPAAMLAGAVGIWLFYVQHQFEDAYWQSSAELELRRGGAAGQLVSEDAEGPAVTSRGTWGCIAHHLNARVPNYNLQRAHDENPIFHNVPTVSLWDRARAVRLKLWDEQIAARHLRGRAR